MATTTTRLALRKPDPDPSTGDFITVTTDINDSMDKIDAAVGFTICTSGTRPTGSNRWDGRPIRETDTGKAYLWDGSNWVQVWLGSVAFVSNANITGVLTVTGSIAVTGGITATTTIVATSTVTASNFIIASGTRSVSGELDQLNNPRRLYISKTGFSLPHNATTDITSTGTAVKNQGSFTYNSTNGTFVVPVNGDYQVNGIIDWNSPGGANTGASDLNLNIAGTDVKLDRTMSRGADGGKSKGFIWEGALTTAQTCKFTAFQNANGGSALSLNLKAQIRYIGSA